MFRRQPFTSSDWFWHRTANARSFPTVFSDTCLFPFLTPCRLDPCRFAPVRAAVKISAACRLAPAKSAPISSAPMRLALCRAEVCRRNPPYCAGIENALDIAQQFDAEGFVIARTRSAKRQGCRAGAFGPVTAGQVCDSQAAAPSRPRRGHRALRVRWAGHHAKLQDCRLSTARISARVAPGPSACGGGRARSAPRDAGGASG